MLAFLLVTTTGVFLSAALAEPAPEPGRVPKVYNALITSNQNLEPSKAFPVYQPVIHDPFAYPFPSVYYPPDFPNFYPHPSAQRPPQPPQQPSPQPQTPSQQDSSNENKSTSAEQPPPQEQSDDKTKTNAPPNTPDSPPQPRTESPIPLNQFGLPPQVLPLGRVGPPYEGFTPVAQYPYTYPGYQLYDPYNPFQVNPYYNLPPFYRQFPNFLGQNSVLNPQEAKPDAKKDADVNPPSTPAPNGNNDDSILNYPNKDPSIPNVPPPPLAEGSSETASSEKTE